MSAICRFYAGKVGLETAPPRSCLHFLRTKSMSMSPLCGRLGIFLFRPPPWPTKVGLSSLLRRSLPAFYADKVEVDVVTLRPFGHISIPSPALADKSWAP